MKGDTKFDIKEIVREGVDLVHLAQEIVQVGGFCGAGVYLPVPQKSGHFLTSCATFRFSRTAQLHRLSWLWFLLSWS
jgi:hypothetical protein